MHYILLILFCVMGSLQAIDLKLPEGWSKEIETCHEGRAFEIWFCGDERVVALTTPLTKEDEGTSLHDVVETMIGINPNFVVLEESETDVLLKNVSEEDISFFHMKLDAEAFHSLMYSYQGGSPEKVDQDYWLEFVKSAL